MNEFVVIKTFAYPAEAYVLKSRLESEGIGCFLTDEQTIPVNPFFSAHASGVNLRVHQTQYQQALQIMAESENES